MQLEREARLEASTGAALQEEKAKKRAEEEGKEGRHNELLNSSAVESDLLDESDEEEDSDEELLDSSDEEEDSDEDLWASSDEAEVSSDEEDSDGELWDSSDEEDDIADDEDRHEHAALYQSSGGDDIRDDDITVSSSTHIVTCIGLILHHQKALRELLE